MPAQQDEGVEGVWADSCARFQSPLASHHSPARAWLNPAGGSAAVSDWRNSSKVNLASSFRDYIINSSLISTMEVTL